MIVPMEMLDQETLNAVIEEYVTRDGFDTGDTAEKMARVRVQLKSGEAQIVFDLESETCNIVRSDR